jgi:hypothetical protein
MPKHSNKFLPFTLLALASIAALALGAAGCGGEDGDDSCYDYASFTGATPAVSFSADVLPIFRNSCGLSGACHGTQAGPAGQPFLGPPNSAGPDTSPAEIDAIFLQNVGVKATKATGMDIVKPGDPSASFLMHKMDNTLTCAAVTCDAACGAPMPLGSDAMPQDKRDVVRRWIAQGAKKD